MLKKSSSDEFFLDTMKLDVFDFCIIHYKSIKRVYYGREIKDCIRVIYSK